ncbi:glycosyltransferase [Paraburkholderia sp. BR10954]|uniref:glycosyltransferase n=1 Tax=Paraburkholderia sp. BR10954 TaxID=3236995 RepID=UPI0034D36F79
MTMTAAEQSFVAFVRGRIDREGYWQKYPDVRAAGLDPVQHWIDHGVFEGRWFAPRMSAIVGEAADQLLTRPWKSFEWLGTSVAIVSTRLSDLTAATDIEFIKYVEDHFDGAAYLDRYPDVKASHNDPLEHWLQYGLYEGRFFAPGVMARLDAKAAQVVGDQWRKFKWLGRDVAFRIRQFRESHLRQIEEQARHDGAIFAPGHLAIPFLPEFGGLDLLARDGIDVPSVFRSIERHPEMIVVTPFLCAGGAEKYAADLVQGFADNTGGRALVIVTDQGERDAKGWHEMSILEPFARHQVLFWRDVCAGYHSHMVLGRFINALRPAFLLVNNSRVGLDAVAMYGRGISQNTSIFCTFFSPGVKGLGVPHGVRFPIRTLPFSRALTDNLPMAELLSRQWAGLSPHGVTVLPPHVGTASEALFQERVEKRRERIREGGRSRRWVWISRIEAFKGTKVLAELAKNATADEFHMYGPMQEQLGQLGLDLPNVSYRGLLSNVLASDFREYDGFVFTSLFEGMPNVVLEMSQHAIPMVLANVGGLASTLSDEAALFVDHHEDATITARRFADAMCKLSEMAELDTVAMVTQAYRQVRAAHGSEAYAQNTKKLFNSETACV